MAVADRNGLPVSVCAESATPHEVKLAMSTLLQMVVPDAPQNFSDRLDAELRFYGIELIAPYAGPKEFDSGWTSGDAIPTKVENR